ncbi:cytochrome P450 [Phanerochaete sordida]|uniref:Cytochrome P450 n=1 Tax=Phanerochaete sordida TaxID=48140 RepID=A0A9P3L7Z3_9APHY|nr:cytochrome P450 [Phanerochaete sordida]
MEATTFGIFFSLLLAITLLAKRQRHRFPPGPRGYPVIGSVLQMPMQNAWLTYQRWGRDYGSDIIYLNVLGKHIYILNSANAVYDLLEKRSATYSDRVVTTMAHELVKWDKNFALLPYGDFWREHRKAFHRQFQPDMVPKYHSHMYKQARGLLGRLLAQPNALRKHLRLMAGATILGVCYGIDAQSENDHYLQIIEQAVHSLNEVAKPGAYLVDFLPILKYLPTWMPGTQFKRDAATWRPQVDLMFDEPFDVVKQSLDDGTAVDSVCASLLSEMDERKDKRYQETVIKQAVETAYIGGADTTVSALSTFVLAMVLNPEVQRTAQKHVDSVTGGDRLPTIEDRDSLPYITAIIKEALRWRPVLPLAVPHISTTDDEYRGYHIPAGSIIMGNAWAVLHDGSRYPNPDSFDPTRFLTLAGELDRDAPDALEAAFGFGRRICAGMHFALDSMWINAAYVFATLDIAKPVEDGRVIEPSGEYTTGLLEQPLPFKISVAPRSKIAEGLIRQREHGD